MPQQFQAKVLQSPIHPVTQTKMISTAELQKLISSGAVKTVTRTNSLSQPTTTIHNSPNIRQTVIKEKPTTTIQNHQIQQQVGHN